MIMSANKTKYAPQTKHKIKIYQSFSLHFSRVNIIGEFPTADKVSKIKDVLIKTL